MPYTGADIYNLMHNPGDTSSLDSGRAAAEALKGVHENLGKMLANSQKALDLFWKGTAADGAKQGLNPLIQASQIAAQNLDRTQQSIADQSSSFTTTKNSVRQVADARPDDQKFTDYVSIGASDDEKAAAKFDSDTKFNVEQYTNYEVSTNPRISFLPADYPSAHDPNVSAGEITPATPEPGLPAGGSDPAWVIIRPAAGRRTTTVVVTPAGPAPTPLLLGRRECRHLRRLVTAGLWLRP